MAVTIDVSNLATSPFIFECLKTFEVDGYEGTDSSVTRAVQPNQIMKIVEVPQFSVIFVNLVESTVALSVSEIKESEAKMAIPIVLQSDEKKS